MPAVHYHRHARQDLEDLWFYIAEDNETAADRYLEGLQERAQTYAASPAIGQLEPEVSERLHLPPAVTLRSFLHRNHRCYYVAIEIGIFIFRVIDTCRDRDTALDE